MLLEPDRFVDGPGVDPLVVSPALDVPVPLPVGLPVSADATQVPEASTTPIPSATANPPTRPTHADAFMRSYLHDPSYSQVGITGVDSFRVQRENWNRTPYELLLVATLNPERSLAITVRSEVRRMTLQPQRVAGSSVVVSGIRADGVVWPLNYAGP